MTTGDFRKAKKDEFGKILRLFWTKFDKFRSLENGLLTPFAYGASNHIEARHEINRQTFEIGAF